MSITTNEDRRSPSMSGRPTPKNQSGFLLVTVLLVVAVLGILVVGTSTTSLIDRQVASRQRAGTEAYYLAHAGLDRMRTALFLALSELEEGDGDYCGPPPDLEVDLGGGVLQPGDPPRTFADFEGSGFYQLRFNRVGGYYILTSVGWLGSSTDRGAQATVQLVATAGVEPFGVWDNAIFTERLTASTGNNQVTGTIASYGSVHVVSGDVDLDPDSILVEYSGSSGVFNNYNGRGQQTNVVEQALKALSTSRAHPYDLCSRLKVEDGSVRVASAAAGIGADGDVYEDGEWTGHWTNPATGEPQVQSIEGVYLGTGNVVYQSQGQTQMYARSGVVATDGYQDLHADFPRLGADFPDPLGANVVALTSANCDLIGEDNVLRIPPTNPGSLSCATENGSTGLFWDEEAKVLRIDGTVAIPDASLAILPRVGEDGDDPDDIHELFFDGRGQFLVGRKTVSGREVVRSGRINIGMEILPAQPHLNYLNDDAQGDEPRLHPTAHGLAFVTAGDIDFQGVTGGGSTVSGLFYAEGTINLPQQVSIVGAVVGQNVHVQQVPRVLWHPDIVALAEYFVLPGSVAALGEFAFPGQWAEVSIEIR